MKRSKKRILMAVLALAMTIGMVLCAQAACTPSEVKVKFNGKTIAFNAASEPKTLKQLEKKWGKKTGTDKDSGDKAYVWEKGGAKVTVSARESGKALGHVSVKTTDANLSVAGISVGMEKDAALKKLQRIYGKKNILVTKKGQDWDFYGEDGYIITGKAKSEEDDCINVLRGHFYPVYFHLEDGRISEIQWMRS